MPFKLHKEHDTKERKLLLKIIGHLRAQGQIRAAENYLQNNVMAMDWIEYVAPTYYYIDKSERR